MGAVFIILMVVVAAWIAAKLTKGMAHHGHTGCREVGFEHPNPIKPAGTDFDFDLMKY